MYNRSPHITYRDPAHRNGTEVSRQPPQLTTLPLSGVRLSRKRSATTVRGLIYRSAFQVRVHITPYSTVCPRCSRSHRRMCSCMCSCRYMYMRTV